MQDGGGVSLFILRTYERMMRNHEIELVLFTQSDYDDYSERIKENGWGQEFIPSLKKNPIKNIITWIKLMKKYSEFNFIHFNLNNAIYWFPILLSKIARKNVIIQSHTSNLMGDSKVKKVLHRIGKNVISKLATRTVAVSDLAYEFMFKSGNKIIIPVGINTTDFKFSSTIRKHLRETLSLEGKTVIGHVGGFTPVKNHEFIIKLMNELVNINKDYHLILIGAGKTLDKISNMIKEYNLEDSVSILGFKRNVADYYNMMDIFIYPSFYEGFPTAVVEAQTNGLPVIMSNTIDKKAIINKNLTCQEDIQFTEKWVSDLRNIKLNTANRENSNLLISGHDIGVIADKLYRLFEVK